MFVSFGNASGAIEAFNILLLSSNGSLVCSRPTLAHFIATRSALESTAQDLFDVVSSGKVRIAVNQRYPLRDAAQAHADLEARRTTGSTLLIP
jgi:NADPH2:quinone reductase